MERTTVGSLLRSTQAYCSELCDKETLDYGIAYYNRRSAALPETNQFREVWIENPVQIGQAFEQTETWFRERDLFCYRWCPAEGQATSALRDFLIQRGFQRRVYSAMLLSRWVDHRASEHIRILPARAMRDAYRETFMKSIGPESSAMRELLAEASLARLDDPHLDMVVALWEKQPAGRCGLYQVGDLARVMSVSVLPAFSGRGVEQALLGHVLTLAKRLTMRNVLTQIEDTDRHGRKILEEAGFVSDGEIVEFEREQPTPVGTVP